MSLAQPSRRRHPGTTESPSRHHIEPLEPRQFLSSAHPFAPLHDYRAMYATTASSAVTGSITGQITDTNGTPLGNATVSLQGVSGHQRSHRQITTDANGDYTLSNVLAGDYVIRAADRGYLPNTSASFTIAAGDNTAPTVQLTALVYGTVTGQVTDTSGNPLANAVVRLHPASGAMLSHQASRLLAVTDANGNYTLNDVPAGDYVVAARDHRYQSSTSDTFTISAGDNTAPTLQLSKLIYGSLAGQVTDTSGNPLANTRIILRPATLPIGGTRHNGPFFFAVTDAQGNYSLSDVLAGDYVILARHRGYQPATSSTFTIASGDNTAPTLQLTAET